MNSNAVLAFPTPKPIRRYYVNEAERRVISSVEPPDKPGFVEVEFMEGCRLVVVCNYDTTFVP